MIYYITYSRIPDGDAMSVRSCNLANTFTACGFDVMLVGMSDTGYLAYKKYNDLSYISLRMPGGGILIRLKNYFGFKKRLKKLLDGADRIDALILNLNTLPINTLWYLKKTAAKKNIKIFVDCCEWYSPEEFRMGRADWRYIQNSYTLRHYINKNMHIIAVSKYITSYFKNKKYNVATIPVVLDVKNTVCSKSAKSSKTILMYAGNMGTKDYLDVILNGMSLLSEKELANIEFRIFGVTLSQIKGNFRTIADKIFGSIKCYGRVPRNVILKNLEDADFTVLMRSSTQRYAKAGFPTKVVESLTSATPVICNLTSDLADYIVDGYNGVVVKGENAEDFAEAVKKAIKDSVHEKDQMSKNARTTAEKNFDYRLWKDKISELMRSVQ